ncbi:hypothetical protein N7532_011372, partial [Penicillium argentinense]
LDPSLLHRPVSMPVHSLQSATRPRKHNKTFTGCWTCRARKVKCDERHPACKQCIQKGVSCEGYDVRLHWMVPDTGLEGHRQSLSNDPSLSHPIRSFRSRIISVDEILVAIDALNPGHLSGQGTENTSSSFIGGFGVFDSTKAGYHELHHEQPAVARAPAPVQGVVRSHTPSRDAQNISFGGISEACQPGTETLAPSTDPPFMEQLYAVDRPFIHPFEQTLDLTPGDQNLDLVQLSQISNFAFQNNDGNKSPRHSFGSMDLSPVIPRSLSPVMLTSNERLLMHYYTTRVVHIFPVLYSPKSPWKTFHLPRVLQSAGEMAVHGSTSQIRSALRNTLLSISAFYLSKHMRSRSQIEEATKWEKEAMHYHGTALNLLNESVNARFESQERPKYKEFLATMLSMVSINIMSGDTSCCGLHLEGASRLIMETAKWKSHYSNKAHALHRIYFFLKTIYDSTAIHTPSASTSPPQRWHAVSPSSPSDASEFINTTEIATSPFTSSYDLKQAGTYENIYAIPKTLLIFLAQTTKLINEVFDAREKSGDTQIPAPLADRCDALETSIMDWHADPTPVDVISGPVANPNIIHNMTQAFHKAIIIFFAQNIRLLGCRYLKPFVSEVMDCIEAVERIKAEWQVSASPLYWPAFIAASEAFDPLLQKRFKIWYAQVEPNAIGSMSTGIRLLQEVWAEGPSTVVHKTSLWRHLARKTDTKLMLN